MAKQLVLNTTRNDIQDFYVGILGGKITRHFTLSEKEAVKILHIPQQHEVYELELQNMQLELLPYEVIEEDSLQHFCFHLNNASDAYHKAIKKHYSAHLRRKDGKETYFITDRNNNLFEIED